MTDRAPGAPLYAAIEAALEEQGKDKAWLERATRVRRTTIERWKTQPRPPKAASINKVAEALGMDPQEARQLGGRAEPFIAGDAATVPLSDVDTDVLLAEIRRRIPD